MRGAHDPLEVRAQMPLGKIRRLAAFADDDDAGLALDLANGLDDVAMAQAGCDLGHAVLIDDGARIFKDRAASVAHELGALRVKFGQFLHQLRAGAQTDRAGEVGLAGRLAPAEHMDQFHGRLRALRDPGGVVANAFGIE
jgi:hypothetical protein